MSNGYRVILVLACLVSALGVGFVLRQTTASRTMGVNRTALAHSQSATNPQSPDFTIEGFGKNTVGGARGTLYTVTNLNDSGPCSLRDFLGRSGPRIIKFDVSGTITLKSHIEITNGNLTIDGGDAPDGGICIRGDSVFLRASNIIVRYVRFRIGPTPDSLPRGDRDNVSLLAQPGQSMSNIVFDHCSFSWADDGNLDIVNGVRDMTVQWCIFSENFGPGHMLLGSGGICTGNGATRVSVHHNLFAQGGRNPEITAGDIDWVNNVVFRDYDGRNHFGPGKDLYFANLSYTGSWNSPFPRVNWVGNYFKAGNRELTGLDKQEIRVNGDSGGCGGVDSVFVEGNIGPSRPKDDLPQTDILYDNSQRTAHVIGTRFDYPQVTTTTAEKAYTEVLANAGANRPCRDAVDTRIVSVVTTGTGVIASWVGESDPATVGGWPDLTQPCVQNTARVRSPARIPKRLGC